MQGLEPVQGTEPKTGKYQNYLRNKTRSGNESDLYRTIILNTWEPVKNAFLFFEMFKIMD
jgi:hypothetical protein